MMKEKTETTIRTKKKKQTKAKTKMKAKKTEMRILATTRETDLKLIRHLKKVMTTSTKKRKA